MSGISPLRPVVRRRRVTPLWRRPMMIPAYLLMGVAVSWPWWGHVV